MFTDVLSCRKSQFVHRRPVLLYKSRVCKYTVLWHAIVHTYLSCHKSQMFADILSYSSQVFTCILTCSRILVLTGIMYSGSRAFSGFPSCRKSQGPYAPPGSTS